jgi:hypothetical protein
MYAIYTLQYTFHSITLYSNYITSNHLKFAFVVIFYYSLPGLNFDRDIFSSHDVRIMWQKGRKNIFLK